MIFRGWECFHSIREQIFRRPWCSKKNSTFPKNIFRPIQRWGHDFFGEISNLKEFLEGFRCVTNIITQWKPLKRNSLKFEISPKKSCSHLWIDRKNIFWKSWKIFRSRISLRIEWEHSQLLKVTLKHRMKKSNFLPHYSWKYGNELSEDALKCD